MRLQHGGQHALDNIIKLETIGTGTEIQGHAVLQDRAGQIADVIKRW